MPDLTYAGTDSNVHGTFEVFHLLADGDSDGSNRRPVLWVGVDETDTIWVAGTNTGSGTYPCTEPLKTKGAVHRHTDDELEKVGIDSKTVCIGAVAGYVGPRAVTLMARVYCPKTKNDE